MLAKCSNAWCSATFRYLDEGRLFQLETDPTLESSKTRATEYFWLCKGCSTGMTLRLAQDGSVVAAGLREALRNGPQVAFASVNRENGQLLRSVSFLRGSTIEAPAMPRDWEQRDDIVAAASSCPVPDCSSLGP